MGQMFATYPVWPVQEPNLVQLPPYMFTFQPTRMAES